MILEVRIVLPLGGKEVYDLENSQGEFLKVMETLYFLILTII